MALAKPPVPPITIRTAIAGLGKRYGRNFERVVLGSVAAIGIAYATCDYSGVLSKHFPNTRTVEKGYAAPRNIEIRLEDNNNDRDLETVISYKENKYYLQTTDDDGLRLNRFYVIQYDPEIIVDK